MRIGSATVTPQYSDGARVIYGIAGSSRPDGTCGGYPGYIGAICPSTVRYSLFGSYLRISVSLECYTSSPGYSWWENTNFPNHENVFQLMQQAYADGLIPVVDFVQAYDQTTGADCTSTWVPWYQELMDFVTSMRSGQNQYPLPQPLPPTYFEIGNEWNSDLAFNLGYPVDYGLAAEALHTSLQPGDRYVILTGGVDAPAALSYCNANYTSTENAISEAEYYGVPQSYLGVAVHPYGYDTIWSPYGGQNFINYYGTQNLHGSYNGYAGVCYDVYNLILTWTSAFPGMPVFFTEDNWVAGRPGNTDSSQTSATAEGAYLVDLFTWLYDYGYVSPSYSPIRLTWFQGLDTPPFVYLGIYTYVTGTDKYAQITYCPNYSFIVGTNSALWYDYALLVSAGCYY